MKHTGKTIAAAAVALMLAVATSAQPPGHTTFVVGVNNNTTTPAAGNVAEGHLSVNCGGPTWRELATEEAWRYVFFDCYPTTMTGPFTMTYKARLADDAGGNPVYHTGTVTIDCPRGQTAPQPGQANLPMLNASSGSLEFTGSGTGITAGSVTCNFPRATSDDSSGDD